VDRKLGTEIFMLLGVLVGFGAAFYSIYRSLMADQRRDEEEAAAQTRAESSRDGRGT
jgi:F0F1-type ATP synthase assembly protein I